jgi:large conductance mechanosensitive channel
MLKDFKTFLLRGNVVDLAVGVAIGVAFTAVVAAFTEQLVTPLLSLLGGGADFSGLKFDVADARFGYGIVVNAVVNFVLVAAVLFFLVVRPVNALMARRKTEPEVAATTKDCPDCLSSIPIGARRCAFCTSEV